MTDLDALADYVRELADLLGLRDWRFEVRQTKRPKHYIAMVHPVEGRRYAVIRIPPDFHERPPEVQRNAIVHELIHCHHAAASDIWRLDAVEVRTMSQGVYDSLWGPYKRELERMVDTLATAIDWRFPLPPWARG